MHEAPDGWAGTRRRRWSAARIAAAIALHALLLLALRLAIDRVELPGRGAERATTLLTVTLHPAPPPQHALPLPAHPQPPASNAPLFAASSASSPGFAASWWARSTFSRMAAPLETVASTLRMSS